MDRTKVFTLIHQGDVLHCWEKQKHKPLLRQSHGIVKFVYFHQKKEKLTSKAGPTMKQEAAFNMVSDNSLSR